MVRTSGYGRYVSLVVLNLQAIYKVSGDLSCEKSLCKVNLALSKD